ncbi:DUF2238 domain-containing protein [Neobacillus sp. NRS-1170]|uniref:DUF2238 domain-containing protein n=1 Tax=Neobacillus sp. NRS-1170 TaxID=3233898 RepID=UPI003D2DFAC8
MDKDKRSNFHLLLLFFVIAVFIWSAIKPAGYKIWTMEVLPAFGLLIIVITTYKKFRLTSLSYFIIALLSILTFIGGHFTYSEVPLFNWIKENFDLKRNNYDRFGHFLKGLFAIVIREMYIRKSPIKKGFWLIFVILSTSLCISTLYEIIEWLSTKIGRDGKATKEFLGMQGDIWDSQWDMSLTFVGSILALIFLSKVHSRLLKI